MSTLDKLTIQNSNFQSKKDYDLPQTPRTPKGQISPKIYSKWDILFIKNNDFHLTPKSSIYFNWTMPLVQNNDLIETPRTPKGQNSPKIYYKWNISFFNFKSSMV